MLFNAITLGCLLISSVEYSDIYREVVPEDRCDPNIGLLISLPLMATPFFPLWLFQLSNQASPVPLLPSVN